jgi:hypothetical protein
MEKRASDAQLSHHQYDKKGCQSLIASPTHLGDGAQHTSSTGEHVSVPIEPCIPPSAGCPPLFFLSLFFSTMTTRCEPKELKL